jgi:hypothetical protein
MFNESDFLSATTTAASSTKRAALPTDIWYPAEIVKLGARQNQGRNDPSKTYTFLDVTFELELPPQVAEAQKRSKAQVRYGVGLDLTPEGQLDDGQNANVSLGRLRKAAGQNQPGVPWNPNMLMGAKCKVQLKHRVDGEDIYEDVRSVVGLNDPVA